MKGPAETRRLLKLAGKYLQIWIEGGDFEHEDPECPEDDTCTCENARDLNQIFAAVDRMNDRRKP